MNIIEQLINRPGLFIAVSIIVVCIFFVIFYTMIRKKKRRSAQGQKKNFIKDDITLPGLSLKNEELLFSNLNGLSMVESNLFCNRPDGNAYKSIYVTSSFNGEGKTICAVNMAFALTINAGSSVLLVDGNPRSPLLHKQFNIRKSPGLINFHDAPELAGSAVVETRYKNLYVLPFGTQASGRPDLVRDNWLRSLSQKLHEKFDYIVFDGNSLIGSSDSIMMASNFDGSVVVIEAEKTKWSIVKSAIDRLEAANIKVIGTVLNKRKYYIPEFLYERI